LNGVVKLDHLHRRWVYILV